jgi:hypothetical protein
MKKCKWCGKSYKGSFNDWTLFCSLKCEAEGKSTVLAEHKKAQENSHIRNWLSKKIESADESIKEKREFQESEEYKATKMGALREKTKAKQIKNKEMFAKDWEVLKTRGLWAYFKRIINPKR